MKRNWKSIGAGLEWCGVLCLVVIGLPLIAIAEFILRAFLLAFAGAGILVGGLFYWRSPRFRSWVDRKMAVRSLIADTRIRH